MMKKIKLSLDFYFNCSNVYHFGLESCDLQVIFHRDRATQTEKTENLYRNIPILPVGILDFCKQKLLAPPMKPMYNLKGGEFWTKR